MHLAHTDQVMLLRSGASFTQFKRTVGWVKEDAVWFNKVGDEDEVAMSTEEDYLDFQMRVQENEGADVEICAEAEDEYMSP